MLIQLCFCLKTNELVEHLFLCFWIRSNSRFEKVLMKRLEALKLIRSIHRFLKEKFVKNQQKLEALQITFNFKNGKLRIL
jgi:hypothetical protein